MRFFLYMFKVFFFDYVYILDLNASVCWVLMGLEKRQLSKCLPGMSKFLPVRHGCAVLV